MVNVPIEIDGKKVVVEMTYDEFIRYINDSKKPKGQTTLQTKKDIPVPSKAEIKEYILNLSPPSYTHTMQQLSEHFLGEPINTKDKRYSAFYVASERAREMVKDELKADGWVKERGKDPKEGRASQYRLKHE